MTRRGFAAAVTALFFGPSAIKAGMNGGGSTPVAVTGSGTWTKPDWAQEVTITVVGGGGGRSGAAAARS